MTIVNAVVTAVVTDDVTAVVTSVVTAAVTAAFTAAGFVCVEILVRQNDPWQTVEGIEFRSMTIRAWKHHKTETTDAINLSDEGCCEPDGNCC